MGINYKTANRSGTGERQTLASTSFGAKKGGSQLQSKNTKGALAYNSCLYFLCFIRYMAFFI